MKNIAEFLKRELFSVQNIFLVSCLFWGILFLFLNPPFQAPDEDAHFFKMYGYTSGSLNFRKLSNYSGQILPESLINIQKYYSSAKYDKKTKTSLKELKIVSEQKLEKQNTKFLKFIPSWYTPLSYFPSFIVLWIMKILNVKPLMMIYILRFCSLLVYLSLTYAAICLMPFKKWLLALIAFLPLSVYQAASISTDGLTIGLGFLLAAYTLKLKFDENPENKIGLKQIFVWGFIFIYLCFCKYAYFPLGLLYLILPQERFEDKKHYLKGFLIINLINLFLILVFLAANFWITKDVITELTAKTGSKIIILTDILKNPFEYLKNVAYTTNKRFGFYLCNVVSSFGWTYTMMPAFLTKIYYILLFLAVFYDRKMKEEIPLKDKSIFILSVLFSYLVIITSVLLLYQRYPLILGVQGRYLTIFLPLIFLLFCSKKINISNKIIPVIFFIASNILMFGALLTMINRFY